MKGAVFVLLFLLSASFVSAGVSDYFLVEAHDDVCKWSCVSDIKVTMIKQPLDLKAVNFNQRIEMQKVGGNKVLFSTGAVKGVNLGGSVNYELSLVNADGGESAFNLLALQKSFNKVGDTAIIRLRGTKAEFDEVKWGIYLGDVYIDPAWIGTYWGNYWMQTGTATPRTLEGVNYSAMAVFIPPYNVTVTKAFMAFTIALNNMNKNLTLGIVPVNYATLKPTGTFIGGDSNYIYLNISNNTAGYFGGSLPIPLNLTEGTAYGLIANCPDCNSTHYYSMYSQSMSTTANYINSQDMSNWSVRKSTTASNWSALLTNDQTSTFYLVNDSDQVFLKNGYRTVRAGGTEKVTTAGGRRMLGQVFKTDNQTIKISSISVVLFKSSSLAENCSLYNRLANGSVLTGINNYLGVHKYANLNSTLTAATVFVTREYATDVILQNDSYYSLTFSDDDLGCSTGACPGTAAQVETNVTGNPLADTTYNMFGTYMGKDQAMVYSFNASYVNATWAKIANEEQDMIWYFTYSNVFDYYGKYDWGISQVNYALRYQNSSYKECHTFDNNKNNITGIYAYSLVSANRNFTTIANVYTSDNYSNIVGSPLAFTYMNHSTTTYINTLGNINYTAGGELNQSVNFVANQEYCIVWNWSGLDAIAPNTSDYPRLSSLRANAASGATSIDTDLTLQGERDNLKFYSFDAAGALVYARQPLNTRAFTFRMNNGTNSSSFIGGIEGGIPYYSTYNTSITGQNFFIPKTINTSHFFGEIYYSGTPNNNFYVYIINGTLKELNASWSSNILATGMINMSTVRTQKLIDFNLSNKITLEAYKNYSFIYLYDQSASTNIALMYSKNIYNLTRWNNLNTDFYLAMGSVNNGTSWTLVNTPSAISPYVSMYSYAFIPDYTGGNVTPPVNDTCTYTTGNWIITDNCNITTSVDVGCNNVTTGVGTIVNFFADLINWKRFDINGRVNTNSSFRSC